MANAAQLKISSELADKIRDHGAQTYPHECCGALLGRDAEVADRRVYREIHALHPLVNRRDDSPNNRFSVTSQDVLDAEKAARQQGLEVVGWYHSHPDHPARPSQYDRDHAWPWYSYIIVSVANRVPEEMTSWRLADDRTEFEFEEIGLQRVAS
ncbi:MAG TPA: M67 family metallopeptidase [Candidatus Acidoferrum sp.]|jgi:proteasome lid subunit RPN8/RPN11|nr:M67 family metallopeptidase [Candidatus Acidoferrum sp.]